MQDAGGVGDKGVLAVPVLYGDGDGWEGPPKIDWETVEACNTGVSLPDETDEDYTRRILFSRVRGGARSGREEEEGGRDRKAGGGGAGRREMGVGWGRGRGREGGREGGEGGVGCSFTSLGYHQGCVALVLAR